VLTVMSPDDFIGVWSGWRVWEDDDLGLAEHYEGDYESGRVAVSE